MECSVDGCDRQKQARGMCNSHYARWRRGGRVDLPILDPLTWLRSTLDLQVDDCIVWPLRETVHYWDVVVDGKTRRATHVLLEWMGQPRPEGQEVLHSCDNKPCVNHRHIRWGTRSQNVREAYDRGLNTWARSNRVETSST